jgi:hypothetical protein
MIWQWMCKKGLLDGFEGGQVNVFRLAPSFLP